jgi:hypothetical protein
MHRFSRLVLATALLVPLGCDPSDSEDAGDPPLAPRELEISEVTGGAHMVWLDESDDEDEFVIERRDDDGEFEELTAVPFDTAVYHDATLTPGVLYTYRVMARNGNGDSEYTAEASITVAP